MSRKKFDNERKKIFGGRVRAIRDRFGWAQNVFAERIGSSAGFISEIENGLKAPGTDVIDSLKRILHVNINWLFTGIGEMFETSDDTTSLSVNDAPTTAYNPETSKLLKAVAEIFSSDNDLIKGALEENIVAFHHAVRSDAKITKLEKEARERDKHIDELERKVSALMKVVNPSGPNTKAKEN